MANAMQMVLVATILATLMIVLCTLQTDMVVVGAEALTELLDGVVTTGAGAAVVAVVLRGLIGLILPVKVPQDVVSMRQ